MELAEEHEEYEDKIIWKKTSMLKTIIIILVKIF